MSIKNIMPGIEAREIEAVGQLLIDIQGNTIEISISKSSSWRFFGICLNYLIVDFI